MPRERILLKLSGANLRAKGDPAIFTHSIIKDLVTQIKELSEDYEIAIVIGGGNIWRGKGNHMDDLQDKNAHYIGMLATMMNAIVLQDYLRAEHLNSTIFSSFACHRFALEPCPDVLEKTFNNKEIVIFALGTGLPFVTTDTCAAVRALELGISKVLIGKNDVKGVYDKDPNVHPDARFFEKITYEEIINKRLDVMDLTALILLLQKRPKLLVFDQRAKNAFVKALKGRIEHTEVY